MRSGVVVTGLGVVSPIGIGAGAFFDALVEGRSGVGPIRAFDASALPTRIAAEVRDFDPRDAMDAKEARRTDRFAQLAIAAARQAIADAGLRVDGAAAERVGVRIGSSIGGAATWQEQQGVARARGLVRVSPFFVPMVLSNMAAGGVAIAIGARGPSACVSTACASGATAIGEAMHAIERGDVDAVVAGGTEAAITEMGIAGFCALRALSTRNDDPPGASRPFDAERDGFVMGEGAGIVVLESREHAERRGARVRAELVGYGASTDAFHPTQPDPEGAGAVRAMRSALRAAGLDPEEVDHLNAHGTGTPLNDRAEARAISAVFGAHAQRLAVSATKSATGHMLGAAGAVELVASVLAIERGVAPPTLNLTSPDPAHLLDHVALRARRMPIRVVMSSSFGFGGHGAVLVVRRA